MHACLAAEDFDKVAMSKGWSEVLPASSVSVLWIINGNIFRKIFIHGHSGKGKIIVCVYLWGSSRFYSQWKNLGNFLKIYPHRLVCIQPLFLMCSLPPLKLNSSH